MRISEDHESKTNRMGDLFQTIEAQYDESVLGPQTDNQKNLEGHDDWIWSSFCHRSHTQFAQPVIVVGVLGDYIGICSACLPTQRHFRTLVNIDRAILRFSRSRLRS